MSQLRDFTVPTARPLPVLLLLDRSGSMAADGKIDVLNSAVRDMLDSFSEEEGGRAEIHVAVVTFGEERAELHQTLRAASDVDWRPLTPGGRTPMGAAFDLATKIIEDRDRVPSRAYRPTVVLVSDGRPTDEWEPQLATLLNSERASKATRFALGIGADADVEMLARFVNNDRVPVFEAHQARQIAQFFDWVTMSVTQRVQSGSPDSVEAMQPPSLDDFEF